MGAETTRAEPTRAETMRAETVRAETTRVECTRARYVCGPRRLSLLSTVPSSCRSFKLPPQFYLALLLAGKALQEVSTLRHGVIPSANQTTCNTCEDSSVFEEYGYRAPHAPNDLQSYLPQCLNEGEVIRLQDEDGDFTFLADGRYADIFLGKFVATGNLVAIKTFRDASHSQILHEGAVQSYLQDTGYVPRLLGVLPCQARPGNTSLVMELLPDFPTFGDVIFRYKLSLCQLFNVSHQLADAILAIHRKFVLHHDLHRENVLIDFRSHEPLVYVIDFGHSTYRKSRIYTVPSGMLRQYLFMSPEAKRHEVITPASDVYSLGLMLKDVTDRVTDGALGKLVRSCISERPQDRPKLWEVVRELRALLLRCNVTALSNVPSQT